MSHKNRYLCHVNIQYQLQLEQAQTASGHRRIQYFAIFANVSVLAWTCLYLSSFRKQILFSMRWYIFWRLNFKIIAHILEDYTTLNFIFLTDSWLKRTSFSGVYCHTFFLVVADASVVDLKVQCTLQSWYHFLTDPWWLTPLPFQNLLTVDIGSSTALTSIHPQILKMSKKAHRHLKNLKQGTLWIWTSALEYYVIYYLQASIILKMRQSYSLIVSN